MNLMRSEAKEKTGAWKRFDAWADRVWFNFVCIMIALWWPVLGLVAVIALCSIAFSLSTGCTPQKPKMTSDECVAVCKEGLHELKRSNLKDCKAAIAKVKEAVEMRDNCILVRPKAGRVEVLSFSVGKLKCFCEESKYKHDDPLCKSSYCSGGMPTKIKVENGDARPGEQLHVECIYYDMANTEMYLKRDQEMFKAKAGKTTTHSFTADIPHYLARQMGKGTVVGVNCFTVAHPRPPVNAVAKVEGRGQENHDKKGKTQ
jgi:hypothetical protein